MRSNRAEDSLRLVLPSDGDLYDGTLDFLRACGLNVRRPSARRYTARIPALPGVEVLFQRTADIAQKVEEGSADLGVTGLDRYLEYRSEEPHLVTLIEDLGYGRCDLVLAVPNSWLGRNFGGRPGGPGIGVPSRGKTAPNRHQVPPVDAPLPV